MTVKDLLAVCLLSISTGAAAPLPVKVFILAV
jgi:hypothetical protein